MTFPSDDSPKGRDSETRTDLGEDLLQEKTGDSSVEEIEHETDPFRLSGQESISELLENAKILLNEGFQEDAKRALRRVLMRDPNHLLAQRRLEEIQAKELKGLLSESGSSWPERRKFKRRMQDSPPPESIDKLIGSLEETFRSILGEPTSEETLFPGTGELDAFLVSIDQGLAAQGKENARDRLDLGIAFYGMGLYRIALTQFERARAQDSDQETSATWEAQSWLELDQPLQAIKALGEIVHRPTLSGDARLNAFYLMAVAQERLGDRSSALYWYQQVCAIDSGFRDSEARMRSINQGHDG